MTVKDKVYKHKVPVIQSASYKGNLSIVDLLLRQGADVNLGESSSAQHEASKRGHVSVVDLLLKSGADDSIRDSGGHIARDIGGTYNCTKQEREEKD